MSDYGGLDKAALDRWITREDDRPDIDDEEEDVPVQNRPLTVPEAERMFEATDAARLAREERAEDPYPHVSAFERQAIAAIGDDAEQRRELLETAEARNAAKEDG